MVLESLLFILVVIIVVLSFIIRSLQNKCRHITIESLSKAVSYQDSIGVLKAELSDKDRIISKQASTYNTVVLDYDEKLSKLVKDIKTYRKYCEELQSKLSIAIRKFDDDKIEHEYEIEDLKVSHKDSVDSLRQVIKHLEDELVQLQIIYYTEHSS